MTIDAPIKYHAWSMVRKYLGVTFENVKITAKEYMFPVTKTCDRDGIVADGAVLTAGHRRAVLQFDNGKIAFYNFCGEQYHNLLRTRHLQIQGDRGEIHDCNVVWLDEANYPHHATIEHHDLGQYSNLEGYGNRGLLLNAEYVYRNPYESARLNDDEIAIASILEGMGHYVRGGAEIYPLRDALQDTYLFIAMNEAVRSGQPVTTSTQQWAE